MLVPDSVKNYVDKVIDELKKKLANGDYPNNVALIDGNMYIGANITRYYLLEAQRLRRDLDNPKSEICSSDTEWEAMLLVWKRLSICLEQLSERSLQEINSSVRCSDKLYRRLLTLTLDEDRTQEANALLDSIDRAKFESFTDMDHADRKIFKLLPTEESFYEKTLGGEAISLKLYSTIKIAYRRIPIFSLYEEQGLREMALQLTISDRRDEVDAMNLWYDFAEIVVYYVCIL